jgi:hypothetical protein
MSVISILRRLIFLGLIGAENRIGYVQTPLPKAQVSKSRRPPLSTRSGSGPQGQREGIGKGCGEDHSVGPGSRHPDSRRPSPGGGAFPARSPSGDPSDRLCRRGRDPGLRVLPSSALARSPERRAFLTKNPFMVTSLHGEGAPAWLAFDFLRKARIQGDDTRCRR